MIRSKSYILSPTIVFVAIGFALLLGVIFFHDTINNGVAPSSILRKAFPMASAKTAAGGAVPDYIVNEVINSGVNIAGVQESCADRPSEVARLICESNQKQQVRTFITQE